MATVFEQADQELADRRLTSYFHRDMERQLHARCSAWDVSHHVRRTEPNALGCVFRRGDGMSPEEEEWCLTHHDSCRASHDLHLYPLN